MTPYKKRRNPYIQRMAEDMQLRNLAESTISSYSWHVDKFCQFFNKPADQLGLDAICEYQLYLVNEKNDAQAAAFVPLRVQRASPRDAAGRSPAERQRRGGRDDGVRLGSART